MMEIVFGIIGFFVGMAVTILIIGLCKGSGRADLEYQIAELTMKLREFENAKKTNINSKSKSKGTGCSKLGCSKNC